MQWIKRQLSHVIGKQAEQIACDYLQQQGLSLYCKNYRCRQGEIDLIMREQQIWVFVEVKYRRGNNYGQAIEYFHQQKRKKVERAVQQFLYDKRLNSAIVAHRLDVLTIDNRNIEWFKSV